MAAADAWYVFADDLPTDQLLVYAFAGRPTSVHQAIEEIVERARSCSELRLRIKLRPHKVGYPEWVPGDVDDNQIVVHTDATEWSGCLATAAELIERHQLDPQEALWRLHVFVGVHDVPGSGEQLSTVAIAQISHALADGMRSTELAGVLFGRSRPLRPVAAPPFGRPVTRGLKAVLSRRRLVRDTETGRVPPPEMPVPAYSTNKSQTGKPVLRTLVRHRSHLPGPSVTVGALLAISEALSGYLREHGEDVTRLTALVPMAHPGAPRARNHSGPEFIGLHPDVPRDQRAQLITAEIDDRRRRRRHPAFAADEAAMDALPGPLRRWVASRPKPPVVLGNTVVSSVNRGPADLSFGGCPVFMSAGYPFLTPILGLAHGVHGIGDNVAISVHTTESVISDIDDYVARLDAALHP